MTLPSIRSARLVCLALLCLSVAGCPDKKKSDAVPPLLGLLVQPFAVVIESRGGSVPLEVTALHDGVLLPPAEGELDFLSDDPAIATVDAAGLVTGVKAGETAVVVTYGEVSRTVRVVVQVDDEPPSAPTILTYWPETSLRVQSWFGRTEPSAIVQIDGAAEPLTVTADTLGHFTATLRLTPHTTNPVVVAVTDKNGNTSAAFEFPIRQDDSLRDAGMLSISQNKYQVGLLGQVLPLPLIVRATTDEGAPLALTEVEFEVVDGSGALSATGEEPWVSRSNGLGILKVRTDSNGYAQVRWRLGPGDLTNNSVYARLPGDVGLPAVFHAEGLIPGNGPTTIAGRVVDEHKVAVAGIKVTLLQGPTTVVTDERGRFSIPYAQDLDEPTAPVTAHVRLDGTTAPGEQKYARIDFVVSVLPGQLNEQIGPYYLPRLPDGVALDLDAAGLVRTEVVLERQMSPTVPATRITVPVGTRVTWPKGLAESQQRLRLIDIPINRTPMAIPDGRFTSHVIALQPGGVIFEPPLIIDMPNLDGLAPGSRVDQLSFDHEYGRFVKSGTATVSDSGLRVVSDPGAGMRVSAWHPQPPPTPCPPCTLTANISRPKPAGGSSEKGREEGVRQVHVQLPRADGGVPAEEEEERDGAGAARDGDGGRAVRVRAAVRWAAAAGQRVAERRGRGRGAVGDPARPDRGGVPLRRGAAEHHPAPREKQRGPAGHEAADAGALRGLGGRRRHPVEDRPHRGDGLEGGEPEQRQGPHDRGDLRGAREVPGDRVGRVEEVQGVGLGGHRGHRLCRRGQRARVRRQARRDQQGRLLGQRGRDHRHGAGRR
jgi:hypothetical protein